MTSPLAAASRSVGGGKCVSKWQIGPDCMMSSALPDATCGASSTSRISRTRPRSASWCAIALPMGPAPRITTRAIARILWGRVCFPQIANGTVRRVSGPSRHVRVSRESAETDSSSWRSSCTKHSSLAEPAGSAGRSQRRSSLRMAAWLITGRAQKDADEAARALGNGRRSAVARDRCCPGCARSQGCRRAVADASSRLGGLNCSSTTRASACSTTWRR